MLLLGRTLLIPLVRGQLGFPLHFFGKAIEPLMHGLGPLPEGQLVCMVPGRLIDIIELFLEEPTPGSESISRPLVLSGILWASSGLTLCSRYF